MYHEETKPWFCDKIDSQLYAATKLDKCEEKSKYVILLIDNMYVKEELVFNKMTGDMVINKCTCTLVHLSYCVGDFI